MRDSTSENVPTNHGNQRNIKEAASSHNLPATRLSYSIDSTDKTVEHYNKQKENSFPNLSSTKPVNAEVATKRSRPINPHKPAVQRSKSTEVNHEWDQVQKLIVQENYHNVSPPDNLFV